MERWARCGGDSREGLLALSYGVAPCLQRIVWKIGASRDQESLSISVDELRLPTRPQSFERCGYLLRKFAFQCLEQLLLSNGMAGEDAEDGLDQVVIASQIEHSRSRRDDRGDFTKNDPGERQELRVRRVNPCFNRRAGGRVDMNLIWLDKVQ